MPSDSPSSTPSNNELAARVKDLEELTDELLLALEEQSNSQIAMLSVIHSLIKTHPNPPHLLVMHADHIERLERTGPSETLPDCLEKAQELHEVIARVAQAHLEQQPPARPASGGGEAATS
jgi:hypothetical protein